MRFGKVARNQQAKFRTTLSAAANNPTDDKGKRYPYLLTLGHEVENLYPTIRDEVFDFFAARGVQWWRSGASGDRAGYSGPTRNLASSQISCINFLLPLLKIDGALLRLVRLMDPDVQELVAISDPKGNSSPLEFEWVGYGDPLEGGPVSRGANQTSVDAFVVGKTARGNRAYLIEWKYCEEYLRPESKGKGKSGETRRKRYQPLYGDPKSPFNGSVPFDEWLHEPFYQIMRMLLLARKTVGIGVDPRTPIADYRVMVVCPSDNRDYLDAVASLDIAKRFPNLSTVEAIVKAGLKSPDEFRIFHQQDLVQAMRDSDLANSVADWTKYHALRYGW